MRPDFEWSDQNRDTRNGIARQPAISIGYRKLGTRLIKKFTNLQKIANNTIIHKSVTLALKLVIQLILKEKSPKVIENLSILISNIEK